MGVKKKKSRGLSPGVNVGYNTSPHKSGAPFLPVQYDPSSATLASGSALARTATVLPNADEPMYDPELLAAFDMPRGAVIWVEFCKNCAQHRMTTKHSESNYRFMFARLVEEFGVDHVKELHDHPPRIGSFEVYLQRDRSNPQDMAQLWSKCETKKFPSVARLAEIIKVRPRLHDIALALQESSFPDAQREAAVDLRKIFEKVFMGKHSNGAAPYQLVTLCSQQKVLESLLSQLNATDTELVRDVTAVVHLIASVHGTQGIKSQLESKRVEFLGTIFRGGDPSQQHVAWAMEVFVDRVYKTQKQDEYIKCCMMVSNESHDAEVAAGLVDRGVIPAVLKAILARQKNRGIPGDAKVAIDCLNDLVNNSEYAKTEMLNPDCLRAIVRMSLQCSREVVGGLDNMLDSIDVSMDTMATIVRQCTPGQVYILLEVSPSNGLLWGSVMAALMEMLRQPHRAAGTDMDECETAARVLNKAAKDGLLTGDLIMQNDGIVCLAECAARCATSTKAVTEFSLKALKSVVAQRGIAKHLWTSVGHDTLLNFLWSDVTNIRRSLHEILFHVCKVDEFEEEVAAYLAERPTSDLQWLLSCGDGQFMARTVARAVMIALNAENIDDKNIHRSAVIISRLLKSEATRRVLIDEGVIGNMMWVLYLTNSGEVMSDAEHILTTIWKEEKDDRPKVIETLIAVVDENPDVSASEGSGWDYLLARFPISVHVRLWCMAGIARVIRRNMMAPQELIPALVSFQHLCSGPINDKKRIGRLHGMTALAEFLETLHEGSPAQAIETGMHCLESLLQARENKERFADMEQHNTVVKFALGPSYTSASRHSALRALVSIAGESDMAIESAIAASLSMMATNNSGGWLDLTSDLLSQSAPICIWGLAGVARVLRNDDLHRRWEDALGMILNHVNTVWLQNSCSRLGLIDRFVSLCRSGHGLVPQMAAEAIRSVSALDKNRRLISEAGGLDTLVALADDHNKTGQRTAVYTSFADEINEIDRLADILDSENPMAMGSCDNIGSPGGPQTAGSAAVGALNKLSSSSEGRKLGNSKRGVATLVESILRSDPIADSRLVHESEATLCNIATGGRKADTQLAESNIVGCMVSTFAQDPSLFERLPLRFMFTEDGFVAMHRTKEWVLMAILTCLSKRWPPAMRRAACRALVYICSSRGGQAATVALSGISRVVDTLKGEESKTVAVSIDVLRVIADGPENIPKMEAEGVVGPLVLLCRSPENSALALDLLRSMAGHTDVRMYSVEVLFSVLFSKNTSKSIAADSEQALIALVQESIETKQYEVGTIIIDEAAKHFDNRKLSSQIIAVKMLCKFAAINPDNVLSQTCRTRLIELSHRAVAAEPVRVAAKKAVQILDRVQRAADQAFEVNYSFELAPPDGVGDYGDGAEGDYISQETGRAQAIYEGIEEDEGFTQGDSLMEAKILRQTSPEKRASVDSNKQFRGEVSGETEVNADYSPGDEVEIVYRDTWRQARVKNVDDRLVTVDNIYGHTDPTRIETYSRISNHIRHVSPGAQKKQNYTTVSQLLS